MPTLQGGDSTAVLAAGLPNIEGSASGHTTDGGFSYFHSVTGAFGLIKPDDYKSLTTPGNTQNKFQGFDFDASRSNAIYGASTTVQPAALQLIPQIKY